MSHLKGSNPFIGNEVVARKTSLRPVFAAAQAPLASLASVSSQSVSSHLFSTSDNAVVGVTQPDVNFARQARDFLHRHLVIINCLLLALIISVLIISNLGSRTIGNWVAATQQNSWSQATSGQSQSVEFSAADATVSSLAAQPVTIKFNGQLSSFDAKTVSSWLTTTNEDTNVHISVDPAKVLASVKALAAPQEHPAINQITTKHNSDTIVLAKGSDGLTLSDDAAQYVTDNIVNNLLKGKGMQLTVPFSTAHFAIIGTESFDKLLEVNIVTKQMYAYEKGTLVRTFAISAGAEATPTPVGQYKIFEKLAVQDMHGYNPNGTQYFQPHVRWINYFLTGGYAVHGNYWRPESWFGNRNSSHGCVSLPDEEAKWVYDWAPIGTTVITHA